MKKERVDVRVEPELLEELEIIGQRGGHSRSSIIREAIANYVLEQKEDWNTTTFRVNITNQTADKVNKAILNNDAKDSDDAVEKALDFWSRDLEDYHFNRKHKMNEIVEENVKKRSALEQMRDFGKLIARK